MDGSASDFADSSEAAFDFLMPMHLQVSDLGYIVHMGPTLAKICGDVSLIGSRFLEAFELRRPLKVSVFADLLKQQSGPVRLIMREKPNYVLKGLFTNLDIKGRTIINLSLGVNVVDAVQRFNLSSADFALSDPTVDMLYLIEAKSVALDESKRLNGRLHGAKEIAEEQAYTDTLTGLKNRRASDNFLNNLQNNDAEFGLMHLDLDFFKQVNDTLGHAAGDHVLQHVADVLKAAVRSEDLVARIGGDEFVLVIKDCVDIEVLDHIAHRIIEQLEKPIDFEGNECRISASIGTTLTSFYSEFTAERMMSDADRALYMSKDQGRAQHTFFDPERVDHAT